MRTAAGLPARPPVEATVALPTPDVEPALLEQLFLDLAEH